MEFRILGPLEVVDRGTSLSLGGARQRAVLALLLTRPNEVVSTDRLIDELWGASPPRTAANTLQYYVSQLRKLLGADRIATRAPGYVIRVEPSELDLKRFERLLEQGDVDALHEALALWRGPPLADLAFEAFAQGEIARLEELRLVALERRIDGDLERGRHEELVAQLEQLIGQHPLRERLRGQLMLALYRSGRQADALAAYHSARDLLVEELGIDPSPALQELERAILRQDSSLELEARPGEWPERSIVVCPLEWAALDPLLALAEPLARSVPPRELILARLVPAAELDEQTQLLHQRASAMGRQGVAARGAAFTSDEPGPDLVRLATDQDADLLLLDGPADFLANGALGGDLGLLLGGAPCDVGVLISRDSGLDVGPDHPVLVPFGGAEHDWAAVELAAWVARASGSALRLLGVKAHAKRGQRDASRLLAQASLMIQRVVRVPAEPLLVHAGGEGIMRAAEGAGLLVFGLSERWRQEGLGETRLALARDAPVSMLLVRKGLRPGGIAPQKTMTRFTWSLAPG